MPINRPIRRRAPKRASGASEELHDRVMQRLFATGIGLQVLADRHADVDTAEQLRRYIAELDETIAEIRAQVFAGRTAELAALRHRPARDAGQPQLSAEAASVVS